MIGYAYCSWTVAILPHKLVFLDYPISLVGGSYTSMVDRGIALIHPQYEGLDPGQRLPGGSAGDESPGNGVVRAEVVE